MAKTQVGVVMGSTSDWSTMEHTTKVLQAFGVPYEAQVISAHRTPDRLAQYAQEAEGRGLQVIVAGAGGAAHLPGMLAAQTLVPVLGVPINATSLQGLDALLSIVQMPAGIPVGTLAVGVAGASNAAHLAMQILALTDTKLAQALSAWRLAQNEKVRNQSLGA